MAAARPECPEGYRRLLAVQSLALPQCEAMLDASTIATLIPDWEDRRRGAALAADCEALGLAAPTPASSARTAPLALSPGQAVGMLYVLEGSRLGARLLHRRLQENPDPHCRAADRFLTHGADERLWTSFVAWLDALELTPTDAIAGAHHAFALFSQAAAATENDLAD